MARFVRKPRPNQHQQRRSHTSQDEGSRGDEGTAEAGAGGEEAAAAEVEAAGVLVVGTATETGFEDSAEATAGEVEATVPEQVRSTDVLPEQAPPGGAGGPEEAAPVAGEEAVPPEASEEAPAEDEPAGEEAVEAGGVERAPDNDVASDLLDLALPEDLGDEEAVDDFPAQGAEPGAGDDTLEAQTRTIRRRRRRRRSGAGAVPDEAEAAAAEAQATHEERGQEVAAEAEAEDAAAGEGAGPDERARRLQMLIKVEGDRVQVSVLEGRTLVEHYVADRSTQSIAGNIYLGKVQNVLPGMEAAFVDIGTPKNAVLYAGDVRYIDSEFDGRTPRIEEILEVGQSVLVQVVKDPMGSKGARLTTEISLPGRFLVLVPENDSTGISRRLQDSERERLRSILKRIRPDGFGVIVRTASEFTDEDKLALDMERLEELWKEIYREATRVNPPFLVYEEPDLVIRTVREIFSGEFRRLIVDDRDVYDKIVGYLGDYEPDLLQRITLYEDDMPLYRRYHVSEQLKQGLSRKVWLPSGGSLVFDTAEALTVVDVNTSKNVGKNNLEETVFANNLEAADEIARQLRLRDIGGIIVIDFIDMENAKNRQAVLRAFKEAVGRDKTKTQVYDISDLGLVEMTRKNVSEGLIHAFSRSCPECSGRGLLIEDEF